MTGGRLAAGFGAAAAVALALSLRGAVPLSVLGLAVFGVVHLGLELRYVIGRFAPAVAGQVGALFLLGLSLVALARLGSVLEPAARYGEVVAGHLVLALGAWLWLRGSQRAVVLALVAASAVVSLLNPGWYFLVLTHVHNLVPVAFLWDWSRRLSRGRTAFLATQLAWAFGIPALILSGALDGLVDLASPIVGWLVGDGSPVVAAASPAGATTLVAARFCVAFAFGQTMHYVVWVGFFPRWGGEATAAFERAFPRLVGWRFAVVLGATALVVGALLFTQWGQGKALYGVLAGYHVYLEFPLLLGLLLGSRQTGFARQSVPAPS